MTYKRPAGVKYTTMAIYIDEHIYEDDRDDIKIYEYCYHLINMLAHQGGYFKNAQYYDDFAVMGATRVFLRLRNPKQFEYDDAGNPKLERIVSVLNYIKSILYPMKVVFERENFKQISAYDNESEDEELIKQYQKDYTSFQDNLNDSIDQLSLIDFDLYLHDVDKTARALIEKIPHKKDDPEWMNIYLSCLLSFLNSVTLSNKVAERLKTMRIILLQKPEILDKLYKEERKNCIILFHLPESMRGYITVLVNRLRHLLARDLSYTAHSHTSTAVNAKNLLRASLEEEDFDNYEDA